MFRLKTSLKVKVYKIAVDNTLHDIDFDEDIAQVISPQTPETTSTLQQKRKICKVCCHLYFYKYLTCIQNNGYGKSKKSKMEKEGECSSGSGCSSVSSADQNTLTTYFKRSSDCPICFKKFMHLGAEEKFNIQVLRYEPDVDIDETKAYKENMENDVVKADKEVGALITSLALEKCGIRRNLKIRRNETWSDYCSYLCKPWLKGCLCD